MRTPINLCAFLLAASLAGIAQETPDRVNVPLSDPSRPAVVHASLMNGGITVTGYNGKEVIVEARHRPARRPAPTGSSTRLPEDGRNHSARINRKGVHRESAPPPRRRAGIQAR